MLLEAFKFKEWADQRTLEAIDKIDGTKFPEAHKFARQQINHIIIVEELFRSRIENKAPPHDSTNTQTIPPLAELKTRLANSADWYFKFVSNLKPDIKNRKISFKFADGKNGNMSIEEILFHILTHSSYHRGSIAHALDLSEIAHPADGYGIFIHESEPTRRKET